MHDIETNMESLNFFSAIHNEKLDFYCIHKLKAFFKNHFNVSHYISSIKHKKSYVIRLEKCTYSKIVVLKNDSLRHYPIKAAIIMFLWKKQFV
ncbi:hypothetical protein [Mycoplasma sp. P36-A1]|uniref:hypothetical protein n=1 Tax=Mycoplasma sp. P36-A1 TaxID=3252900 RepID=UPI003C2BEBB8